MDPVTLATISIGASAAGAGVSAYGSMQGGEANARMYQYQAGVAGMNQTIAKQNADYFRAAGELEAQHSGMKTRAQLGGIRAAQGAKGLDVNRGSAVDVRASQADIGAHEADVIRSNAARRAYGAEVEAVSKGAQKSLYSAAAGQSRASGNIAALGNIISGAASVSGKWLQASRAGIWGPSVKSDNASDPYLSWGSA